MLKKPKIVIDLFETAKGHWYKTLVAHDTEILFPSSTTILECFPSPDLDFWKTNTSPEEIKEKQDAGKIQGTKVHHCIDVQIKGSKVSANGLTEEQIGLTNLSTSDKKDKKLHAYLQEPLTERESKCLVGFENFWQDRKPVTVANEIQVANFKKLKDGSYDGYAGTLDWIGYLLNPKTKKYELWLLDWKSSKTPSKTNHIQVVSYLKAFEFTYKKKLKDVKLGVVYLGNTTKKKYTLTEVKEVKLLWELFQITKRLWDFLNPSKLPQLTTIQEEYSIDTSHKVPGKILTLTGKKNEKKKQRNLPLPGLPQKEEQGEGAVAVRSEAVADESASMDSVPAA